MSALNQRAIRFGVYIRPPDFWELPFLYIYVRTCVDMSLYVHRKDALRPLPSAQALQDLPKHRLRQEHVQLRSRGRVPQGSLCLIDWKYGPLVRALL